MFCPFSSFLRGKDKTMSQLSPQTLQAQLAIYDEHLTQAQQTWSDLREQLARSRTSACEELQQLLAHKCQYHHLMASTPPATCAAEDRVRMWKARESPLSETEQLVVQAKGHPLTRAVILLLGLVCPIIPLLVVRRVRELRLQAFREWTYTLHAVERDITQLKQEIRFQKDTDAERAMRNQIAGADRTIQQLQLQRDVLLARIRELERDPSSSHNSLSQERGPSSRSCAKTTD